MNLPPSDHVVWSIIRLVAILAFLTITLAINASDFDETELKTLLWTSFAIAGTEGVVKSFTRQN